jgi:hypothetical protein
MVFGGRGFLSERWFCCAGMFFWKPFWRRTVFGVFSNLAIFSFLPDFWTAAFFVAFRAAFDFVFFAIAILPDIYVLL